MSFTSPFMPTPLPSGPPVSSVSSGGTTQWSSGFVQHGIMEQPVGHPWSSITPPRTPRSALSPAGRRERERSRDRRRNDDGDHEPGQGWGPRIIALEQKIVDLQTQINNADANITSKINDHAGRLNVIDAVMPQRLTGIEKRQEGLVGTMNAVTSALSNKVEQIEQLLLTQADAPRTPPQMSMPQSPLNIGGRTAQTATQHFHVGSPLSAAPPAPPGFGPSTPDPWAQYSSAQTQHSQPNLQQQQVQPPMVPPQANGSSRLPMKMWD